MRIAVAIFPAIVVTLLVAGCVAPSRPTPPADTVVARRLNPEGADAPADPSRPLWHDIETLAERPVDDATLARHLRAAVTDPANFDGPARGRCFLPRLGVRVMHGSAWTDYVICTQCHRIETHASDGSDESMSISPEGAEAFDALMADLFPGITARPVSDQP